MTNILDPLELFFFKKHNMAADGDDIIVGGETRQQPRAVAFAFVCSLLFLPSL